MRTTVELDQSLVSRAQAEAVRAGVPVGRFIEQLIERELGGREQLARDDQGPARPLTPLPVFRGGTGLAPHANGPARRSGWLYEDRDGKPLPFPVFYGGRPGESDIDWTSNASIYAAVYEEEDERIRRWSTGESPDL